MTRAIDPGGRAGTWRRAVVAMGALAAIAAGALALPAPGYSDWFSFIDPAGYYDYTVSNNGTLENYGGARTDYSTDVLTQRAEQFVAAGAPTSQPFFLWLAYNAPHDSQLLLKHCGRS